ncbi:MAG: biopolymer transporter ExbD [Candidatus Latescibacterota bacterium]|nr:biopolymer transporter ExbD [Gemmatimonadaceae bacterium]MDP6981476.1 biopolymer transporter ExbD [Candidatus Latescibacterota bacterium]MEC8993686.1 biopolymer transporter ExbD [Candidatus Latescibacterota bacterium]MED5416642.1 biopolymer transporter ExbD [Candidatus Latescibacterota bacterium]MEE3039319.1 biopolymer transporter ExbD [Candidatus Latescibacterota bacterium]
MNLRKRTNRVPPEIPTSSMADIAFLLIVFFLVSTTMNQDKGLSLHLPPVAETKEVRQKNICNVWINDQDQIAFFESDQLTVVEFANLRTNIQQRLAANENLIVSLKAERASTYRMFVDVLDELKLAGATRISIAEPAGG